VEGRDRFEDVIGWRVWGVGTDLIEFVAGDGTALISIDLGKGIGQAVELA
jgi:hypothetical protein